MTVLGIVHPLFETEQDASLISLKKRAHSSTDGVFGGQVPPLHIRDIHRGISSEPLGRHDILRGNHLKSSKPWRRKRASRAALSGIVISFRKKRNYSI